MSLPAAWIDRIFERLTLVYGRLFTSQFDGADVDAARALWAHELGGFIRRPEAIKHALEHLPPDRPPNVLQIAAMARACPVPAPLALPSPRPNLDRMREALARLRQPVSRDPLAWAKRLRDMDADGELLPNGQRMTQSQRDMYRRALGMTEAQSETAPTDLPEQQAPQPAKEPTQCET